MAVFPQRNGRTNEYIIDKQIARQLFTPGIGRIKNITKNDLKLKKANDDKIAQEQYEAAKELGKQIEAGQIQVSIKMGEGGKAFGSVSSKEIAEEVKKQLDLTIDKKKVQLKEAIKVPGTHVVPIKLHPKVTADLKVLVTEEA